MTWPPIRAVIDANVLYPALLRDLVLRAAEKGVYQPVWSEQIIAEVMGALQRDAGVSGGKVERLRNFLLTAFPEAMTDGYQHLTDQMQNQIKDRHVAALGYFVQAHVIVTNNIKHFKGLAGGPTPKTADEFLCDLYQLAPLLLGEIIGEMTADYSAPAQSPQEIVGRLGKVVPRFCGLIWAQWNDAAGT